MRSAGRGTLGADGLDLYRRCLEPKAQGTGAILERPIQDGVLNFGDSPADAAHEKLSGVLIFGPIAAEKGVQRIQPMYQSGVLQKFERPVNRRWSGLFAVAGQFGQDFVSADGLVLPPDDLENPFPQRCEVHPSRRADFLGRRDRTLYATRVIVCRFRSLEGHVGMIPCGVILQQICGALYGRDAAATL